MVDCADASRSAEFWSAILGVGINRRYEQYVFLDEVAPGVRFTLQEVPEPKQAKSRVHFDVQTDDPAELIARAVALGGAVVSTVDNEAYGLTVMADPDGNEFCINERLSAALAAPAPAGQAGCRDSDEGR